jgi:ribosomal protein L7/L12
MTNHDAFAENDDGLVDAEGGNTPMPTNHEIDALLRAVFAAKGKPDQEESGTEAGEAEDSVEALDAAIENQIVSLLEKGRKNKAIKLCRKQTGAGLKEANEIVEAIAANYGISPKKAGCAGMVLLMVVVSASIGVGLWVLPG